MIRVIKQILPKDQPYYLALSMGVDSVAALFWMLWKGYKVTPLHFDHNLRAQNEIMHQRFIQLCNDMNLNGKSEVWSKGFGTEAECREARLDFYTRAAKNGTIVTAHHLDDWIENYLLNCLRGHPNHTPISLVSNFENYKVIHPFLLSKKTDFKQYLERNGYMKYVVEDESNKITKGSRRNWVRTAIIPQMTSQKLSLEKFARRRIGKLAVEIVE